MDSFNRKFTCPQCGKQYVHKTSLYHHKSKVHYSQKFVCPICKKNYQYKGRLNRHLFVAHKISEISKKSSIEKLPKVFEGEIKRPALDYIVKKHSALSDKVVRYEYKLEGRSQVDLNFACLDMLAYLQENLEYLNNEWRGLKASLYCSCLLSKPTPILSDKEETIIAHLRSDTFLVVGTDSENLTNLIESACMNLLTQLDSFSQEGSGWTLEEILEFHLNAAAFSPLSGGCLKKSIPAWIRKSRSTLDVKNSGDECFRFSVLASLLSDSHKNLNYKSLTFFHKYESLIDVSNLKFPVKINSIARFENKNPLIAINVFGVEKNKKSFYPIRVSDKRGEQICVVDLLLINQHFMAITNKSRLFSSSLSKNGHKRYFCDYCINSFSSKKACNSHVELCQKQNPQKTYLPTSDYAKLKFSNIQYTEIQDFFIALDFECLLPAVSSADGPSTCSWTRCTQKHVVCNFAFCTIDSLGNLYTQPVVYTGPDAGVVLLQNLQAEVDRILNLPVQPMLPLTEAEQKRVSTALVCEKCQLPFSDGVRVHDHSHYTGKFRYVLCRGCNLQLKMRQTVTCVVHNLSRYDQFLILEAISKIYNPAVDKLTIIPRTLEKWKSFTFNKIKFVDSLAFMAASLENIVKTLGANDFRIFEQHFRDQKLRDLLKNSKQLVCYEYLTSFETLKEPVLPAHCYFYSSLTDSNISLADYNQCLKIFKAFNCNCIEDYLSLYVKCDVLLLACCMQNFRLVNFRQYGLDPLHFISAPSFYYQACLKMSGIVLDLFKHPDEYLIIENGVRGGLSQVFERHCLPNNNLLPTFDSQKPSSHCLLLDQNSLYAAAQYHYKMPVGGYEWLKPSEIRNLNVTSLDVHSDVGYIFYLDLDYPDSIKENTKIFPLCPTTTHISYDMLSDYQKNWLSQHNIRYPKNVSKLVATQLNKSNLTIHLAPLLVYLSLGMEIKKIHRVLKYQQSYWLRDWVRFNIDQRKSAVTKFEKNTYKLAINSTFGSFLLCKRKQRKVTLVANEKQLKRLVASPHFTNANVVHNTLCVVEHRPSYVFLDRPYILGFCILDHSKAIVYDYFYNTLLKTFNTRLALSYCDTDSYFITLRSTNIVEDLRKISDSLDTSNYEASHPLYSVRNEGRLLCVKDEMAGIPIQEAVFIKAKCYSILCNNVCTKKLKGVSKRAVEKKLTFDHYKSCLEENSRIFVEQTQIANKDFLLFTTKSNRLAISCFDDKSFYLDALNCLPHGYPHRAPPSPLL